MEEISDIIDSVKCKQETLEKYQLIQKHSKIFEITLKSTLKFLSKKIEAPLQDKNNNKISPKLVAWMEIN